METKIKNLILVGKFLDAKQEASLIDSKKLEDILLGIGCDEINICAYSFICFLLQQRETAEYHSIAWMLLSSAFSHWNGAYYAALHHARKAIELSPQDIELLEMILFLNVIPEKVVDDEEAKTVAKEILQKNPQHQTAQNFLARFKS